MREIWVGEPLWLDPGLLHIFTNIYMYLRMITCEQKRAEAETNFSKFMHVDSNEQGFLETF